MASVTKNAPIDNRVANCLRELSAAAAEALESRDPRVKILFRKVLRLVLRDLREALA